MIIGKIHPGSGLGDQLFSYLATVFIADGDDYAFVGKEFFKGKDFMNLFWGEDIKEDFKIEQPSGKLVTFNELNGAKVFEINKPYYDPEVNFIEDGTIIDGYGAQDSRYYEHEFLDIHDWIQVEPLEMPDDVCVINFRGGEFALFPELFLAKDYWDHAMELIKSRYSNIIFEVHTDDPELAKQFFPNCKIIKDIGINWRSVRYAKHLILSNSAFGIIPALLNENAQEIIAPRYWARRNIGEWAMPSNYYKKFQYI